MLIFNQALFSPLGENASDGHAASILALIELWLHTEVFLQNSSQRSA